MRLGDCSSRLAVGRPPCISRVYKADSQREGPRSFEVPKVELMVVDKSGLRSKSPGRGF